MQDGLDHLHFLKKYFLDKIILDVKLPCGACSGSPNPSKILEVSSLFQSRSDWTFITPCDVSACSFRLSSFENFMLFYTLS